MTNDLSRRAFHGGTLSRKPDGLPNFPVGIA